MKKQNKHKSQKIKNQQNFFKPYNFNQELHNQESSLTILNRLNQSSMLVTNTQTERYKLDFLVTSYSELIQQVKQNRKQYLELIKMQLQKHNFYFTQIKKYVKQTEQNTKKYLKQKFQDISNIFKLKITFLEIRLKQILKTVYGEKEFQSFIKKSQKQINTNQIDKITFKHQQNKSYWQKYFHFNPQRENLKFQNVSSYQQGLNFDIELKELYGQKNFKIQLDFIENIRLQQSLKNVIKNVVTQWSCTNNQSVSFSSISLNEKYSETFQNIQNSSQNNQFSLQNGEENHQGNIKKQINRRENIQFVSKGTNSSSVPKDHKIELKFQDKLSIQQMRQKK